MASQMTVGFWEIAGSLTLAEGGVLTLRQSFPYFDYFYGGQVSFKHQVASCVAYELSNKVMVYVLMTSSPSLSLGEVR